MQELYQEKFFSDRFEFLFLSVTDDHKEPVWIALIVDPQYPVLVVFCLHIETYRFDYILCAEIQDTVQVHFSRIDDMIRYRIRTVGDLQLIDLKLFRSKITGQEILSVPAVLQYRSLIDLSVIRFFGNLILFSDLLHRHILFLSGFILSFYYIIIIYSIYRIIKNSRLENRSARMGMAAMKKAL